MSIVKQIVDLSGGEIEIRSELGKGTVVKLSLPLEDGIRVSDDYPALLGPIDSHEDPIEAVRRRTKGRTVTLRGFESKFGSSNLQLAAVASLKASIEKYVTEWFHLKIVSNDEVADILISDGSAFLNSTKIAASTFRLLLILCSNGVRRDLYTSRLESGQTVEFISKPFGPHRLAKALLNVLDTEEALEKIKNRVSLEEARSWMASTTISTERGIVTTGLSSSKRLIGDLQSSIGFSPTAIGLQRQSEPFMRAGPKTGPRPSFMHRRSSGVAVRLSRDETVKSESSSNGASDTSSTPVTSNSSASHLEEEEEVPSRKIFQDATVASRPPKMLLVEVASDIILPETLRIC
jgi:hypothetical protein